jgi:hydrogenase maturation factor HypE
MMTKSLLYILVLVSFSCQSSVFDSKEDKLRSVLKAYDKPAVLDKKVYIVAMVGGCTRRECQFPFLLSFKVLPLAVR